MIRDDARGSAPTPLSKDTQSGIVAAIATDERPAPVSTIIYEHDPGDLKLIAAQEKTIAAQEKTIAAQERRIGDLEGRGFRPERSSGAPSADFPYTSSGKNPLLK
jgi:hypothetical protein